MNKALYTLLASDAFRGRFPWPRVHWYWGDERFVPHDHPDSNYRMTREAMLAGDRPAVLLGDLNLGPRDVAPVLAATGWVACAC